uniref:UAS domain-containing protein n=1 Tax=Ditylenchus dipsaci TaxID=166011 RepID=A0A915CWP0_9BILA
MSSGEEDDLKSMSVESFHDEDDDYISEVSVENAMEASVISLSDDDDDKEKDVKPDDHIPLSRYGSNFAPFYRGTVEEAMAEAFEAPGRDPVERRPLAIYLHNDNSTSVASNIFAQNVMCSNEVSSLLKRQFLLWAWDMSEKENRKKLYEWFSVSAMSDVSESIKTIHRSKYPLLTVLVKERDTIYPVAVVKGHDGKERTVQKLLLGLDVYMRIKNREAAERHNKVEREQILQQQAEDYQKSLARDRAKQEEQAQQRQREREEELQKQHKEYEKQVRQTELASLLPAEPAENEPNIITIRIRLPTGEHKTRRFSMEEELNWHRVWTSDLPKKDISTFDLSKTFSDLNWMRREQVTVEEK